MKTIKMTDFVAPVALVAMIFAGTSTAMAESTALCKADETSCASGNKISHVHEVTLSGNKAKLLTGVNANIVTHVHETTLPGSKATLLSGIVEVKCDVLLLGDVENAYSSLGTSLLGNFTYTNCVRENGKSCEVKETSSGLTIKVVKPAHELATVTGSGEVNVHCGVLINCTYDGEGLQGHALGPLLSEAENGEVSLEKQKTHRVKGVCPETAKLDILTSPLEATYISGQQIGEEWSTELCKEDAEIFCEEDWAEATVECDVLFLGDVQSESSFLGSPLEISGNFTYTNCKSVLGTECTVSETSSSSAIAVLRAAHELAAVTGSGEVNVHCGFVINCTYDGEGLQGHALGLLLSAETSGEIRLEGQVTHRVKGLCPEAAELDILATPLEAVYITR